jgi:hypothetical protein
VAVHQEKARVAARGVEPGCDQATVGRITQSKGLEVEGMDGQRSRYHDSMIDT